MTWSDEFNGAAGQAVDATKWVSETGPWPNNAELEFYTNGTNPGAPGYTTQNLHQDGAGNLVIEADRQSMGGRNYTSARITTAKSFTQTYGKFEARMKIPPGQGMWPAFWMLGSNIGSVGWPNCGEIDTMENIGKEVATVHGTVHGPGGYSVGGGYTLPNGQKLSDDFHVYGVEWSQSPSRIQFTIDGIAYETVTPAMTGTWVFNRPFFMLLNLAVGGSWPGNPTASTPFPARMLVDYVRVYQHN